MPPMQSIDGAPPTQHWAPQTEPLNLNEPIGLLCDPNEGDRPLEIRLEDLDPAAAHRIESWPEAIALIDDAIEEVESWAAYASDYFQEKHDLAGTLADLRSRRHQIAADTTEATQ